MKYCIKCNADITAQESYRGKYCIKCDNLIKKNKKIERKKHPELYDVKNGNEKKCKICNKILHINFFRHNRRVCKICENLNRKKAYYANRENEIKRIKKYKENNRDKVLENKRKRERYHNDYDFRMKECIRSRFTDAIKKNKNVKKKSTFEYIGCSIEMFKKWIEYNFDENMKWDNYGKYWQIDHIIPCASFDFSDEKNIYTCFNWANLAPLEISENIRKSNKIDNKIIQYYKKRKEKYIKSLEIEYV